ncbi:MAG: hypothetical protein EBV64_12355 [Oxalobacteraceae bacterium]|jgi:hypothetical protein|nr:hypothetical protein [Oxalobacteraceae bacterium]
MVRNSSVIIAALLFCHSAAAEWTKVGENIRGTAFYVDKETIEAQGNTRKLWELESFREPTKQGISSIKVRREYDCAREAVRYITYTAYSGKFADGEQLGVVNNPSAWDPVPGNPSGRAAYRMVCH